MTWGGVITLALDTPSSTQAPGKPVPPCFTITITGSGAPGGVTAGLCPKTPSGNVICPQIPLDEGPNEVCFNNVVVPSYCTPGFSIPCATPADLASGLQSITIQAQSGDTGGAIDVCVSSIVPHDYPAVDAGSDAGTSGGVDLPVITPGQFDARSYGTADLSKIAFSAFSAMFPHEQDPQVLDLAPDLVPRAWFRWDTKGLRALDYDRAYVAACQAKGISFMGGTTTSVLYEDEVSPADFLDQVSRDASNKPVLHTELGSNVYRGSLASPAYRQRMVNIGKLQIDAGADGVHFDEVITSYTGAGWTGGNEGFDDHGVADFGAFLCNKYATSLSTLTTTLGVLAADKLDCTGPSGGRTFDYRGYIARHGAGNNPLNTSQNPLAADWGAITNNNRVTVPTGTFLSQYPGFVYWQQIVLALRTYAREKYNREILVSANGVYPFVDFQTLGIYTPNADGPHGTSFDWVPTLATGSDAGTNLDGTVSFKSTLLALKAMSRDTLALTGAKEVPIVLFLDYAAPSLTRYYGLSLQGRKDYFRLYAAEAYAIGMMFSVPLAMNGETCTATAFGMMDFFKQLQAFYKGHADVYRGSVELSDVPAVSAPNVTTTLNALPDGRTVLHIINHSYSAGVVAQHGVTATIPLATAPTSVTLISPDYAADKTPVFTYADGSLSVTVGDLDAYVAIVVK